jgi:hypothetical protein
MTMKIYVISGKAKPNTGNINGSNLAVVKLMIAPVFELPQYNISMICCTEPGLTKACEKHIQGVTGGTDNTSGGCSLGQTIPI